VRQNWNKIYTIIAHGAELRQKYTIVHEAELEQNTSNQPITQNWNKTDLSVGPDCNCNKNISKLYMRSRVNDKTNEKGVRKEKKIETELARTRAEIRWNDDSIWQRIRVDKGNDGTGLKAMLVQIKVWIPAQEENGKVIYTRVCISLEVLLEVVMKNSSF
jgi:hypothetical protein